MNLSRHRLPMMSGLLLGFSLLTACQHPAPDAVAPAEKKPLPPGCEAAAHPDFTDLRAQALEQDHVAVMVELRIPFSPEGSLDDVARHAQREHISAAQAVIEGLLRDGDAVLARYASIPHIALKLSPHALDRVICHPDVASVRLQKQYQSKQD